MRYLTLAEVIAIHRAILDPTGGAHGIRDLGALKSSVAQPHLTFSDQDLYPTLPEKAAALGFAIVSNHPFVDGNKRAGHAAIESMLLLNGHELLAPVDEQEAIFLKLAAGSVSRDDFTNWVVAHTVSTSSPD